jgi:hypothetical protein
MTGQMAQEEEVQISYTARANATLEAEVSTLANVYRFILDCSANKPSSRQGRRDNAIVRNMKGVSHVDRRSN